MMTTALDKVRSYYPDVTKVIDAKRSVKIEVLKRDCKGSIPNSPNECVVARAAKRKGYDGALISLSRSYLIRGKTAYRYTVRGTTSREITVFDRLKDGDRFTAGTIILDAPCPRHRLGVTHKQTIRNKNGKPKKRTIRNITHGVRVL